MLRTSDINFPTYNSCKNIEFVINIHELFDKIFYRREPVIPEPVLSVCQLHEIQQLGNQ